MVETPYEKEAWGRILDIVEESYRQEGGFARKFARGKLARDPVYRRVVSAGYIARGARVVDVGCGQGLLGSLLRAAEEESYRWPSAWAAPPSRTAITGIDLAERDLERARAALGPEAELIRGDIREVALPRCDVVVMFDVLHYIEHHEQDALLARAAAALEPGGRLLLRVGDTSARGSYAFSQLIDRLVALARRNSFARTFGRTVASWTEALERLHFTVEAHSMSQGTPFANVLLVCDLARDGQRP